MSLFSFQRKKALFFFILRTSEGTELVAVTPNVTELEQPGATFLVTVEPQSSNLQPYYNDQLYFKFTENPKVNDVTPRTVWYK